MAKVNVTTSATLIAAASDRRISIIIQNSGSETVYFGATDAIVAAEEPFLLENASFEEDNAGGRFWKGDIYGITSTSSSDVYVWERLS